MLNQSHLKTVNQIFDLEFFFLLHYPIDLQFFFVSLFSTQHVQEDIQKTLSVQFECLLKKYHKQEFAGDLILEYQYILIFLVLSFQKQKQTHHYKHTIMALHQECLLLDRSYHLCSNQRQRLHLIH